MIDRTTRSPFALTCLAILACVALVAWPSPAAAEGECPNEAIREQQGSTFLADCRAWELMSPPDTNGNSIFATKASPDGERVAFSYQGGVPGSPSGSFSLRVAERTATGWRSRNLLPPRDELLDTGYTVAVASADLSRFVIVATHGYPQPKAPVMILRLDDEGNQTLLQTLDPTLAGALWVAASDDLQHVLTNTGQPFVLDHEPGSRNVYDFGSGTPVLVSRMPDGSVPACGVPQHGLQSFSPVNGAPQQHWVSTDGRRAFFHSSGSDCGGPADLYMRDLEAETTTLISSPPVAGPNEGAVFLQATPDGSQVFYATANRLDPADLNATRDIYRYTIGAGNACLTCVVPGADVANPAPENIPVLTEDGSRIYFSTEAALTPSDTDGTESAYLLEGGSLTYVAPVNGLAFNSAAGGQATPDGSVLVFRSNRPALDAMTGRSNGGFFQYYRYDREEESLACISCPTAAPATRDVLANMASWKLAIVDNPRIISDDGSLIAFKTREALVLTDTNGDDDIYQWRDGVVSLVTDGVTEYSQRFGLTLTGSQVVGVSEDGGDILFHSFSALTPDVLFTNPPSQLYDARSGGGFSFPSTPALCQEDGCRAPPSTPPLSAPVGTTVPVGDSNVTPKPRPRCRRNQRQVRRHGRTRCVRKNGVRTQNRKRAGNDRRTGR